MPRQEESEHLEAAARVLQPAAVITGHVSIVLVLHCGTDHKKVAAPLDICRG